MEKTIITMIKHIKSWVGVCLLLLVSANSLAVPLLYDIRYNPILPNETEIAFVFDEEVYAEPNIQVFNEPSRIELFFDETDFEENLTEVLIGKSGVTKVTTQFLEEGIKVVIYLDYLKIYQSRVENNIFYLHVSDTPQTESNNATDVVENYINTVQAIDFRRGENGEGRVLIFLQENMAAVDVTEKTGKILIEFHNTDILEDLLYQLDVLDFGTVVKSVETFKDGANSRIVIDTTGAYEYTYQQIENIFTIAVEKDISNKGILGGGKDYKGKPISLNFQDLPVRTVLQIIADVNGLNLVTTDSVSGNITLRLDGVPWDQALDIILKVKGLDKRMDGSILMVAPAEELAAREAKELEVQKKVQELEPLYSEFIQINYAKALDISELLKSEGMTLLSDRGNVSVDERTNTLLIKDTAHSIASVRTMVETLDIPIKQVLIESRMVTVRDNIDEELGIRWGITDQNGSDGIGGSLIGAETVSSGIIPALTDRLNVNLPIVNPAGSIGVHVAKLADGTLLDLELSALERENKGEVIASPRITTSNQQQARIEQGTEIPYVQAASSGATTVSFKKAVLSLEVTPHITPDNRIILDLVITQDTRGDTVQTPTGPAVAIDTQRIQTQVLADNGETVVLGGIFQQQVISAVTKVPVLGDIPYIGQAFRTNRDFNEKKELLIFVTPKIITESF